MSLPIEEERWLPVVGYEGLYEVSNQGRVRSLDRLRICSRIPVRYTTVVGRELSLVPQRAHDPRRIVNLYRDGKGTTRTVATLVLEAFVGPRPAGMQGCHNDGESSNDRLENLRWDTGSENQRDSVRHGTHNEARRTHCPLAHPLVEPNLRPDALRQNRRGCLACARAGAYARTALRRRGEVLDRTSLAHDYFARIMGGR